jgi:hypothetical protein
MRNIVLAMICWVGAGSQASWARVLRPAPVIVTSDTSEDYRRPQQAPQTPQPIGGCLEPTRNARVVALGAYEGASPLSFFAPGDSSDAGAITVAADRKGPPVLLVLSAYDPVVWDLRQIPNGRLEGVLAYGHAAQAVVGVPRNVPVRFSAGKRADSRCGPATYAYRGGQSLDKLAANVKQATGRPIDRFYGEYAPAAFNVDGGALPLPDTGSITLRMLVGSELFDVSAVPPKAAGVAALLQQGAIRRATADDQAELNAALTRASPTGYLAPATVRLSDRDTFVILKPTTIPRGMYGAHSATFLIPRRVPLPDDPGSHNTYYRLDGGKCVRGPRCPSGD